MKGEVRMINNIPSSKAGLDMKTVGKQELKVNYC